MPKSGFPIKTIIIILIFIAAITLLIYWLWQRQPRGLVIENPTSAPQAENQSATSSAMTQTIKVDIADNKVASQNKLPLEGQTQPNSLVVIYSDSAKAIVKADASGKFASTVNLDNGLNLISVSILGPDFKEIAAKNLTYFVSGNTKDTIVYAGLVKNIFEDTITLTTASGDIPVTKSASTQVNIPKLPGVQTQESDIRVGDYMIALGNTMSQNQLETKSIDILRDNKPQNQTHYATVKILSPISRGVFQALQNGQTTAVKITTNIDTAYFSGDQQADAKSVVKDKSAILIFHEDSKSNDIADIVYLLP